MPGSAPHLAQAWPERGPTESRQGMPMDEATASRILDHNRRLHDAPEYAATYDRRCGIMAHPWERKLFERDAAEIAAALGPPEGQRVLDIGCGTGSLTLLFLERGFRVHGVDLSKSMLAQLRAKAEPRGLAARLTTHEATADDFLASTQDAFDAILFSAVLHHLPDYLGTLRRAAARTRVGGLLYIVHEPSLIRRVGCLARLLEACDRALEEIPDFLRRQVRDLRREGLLRGVAGKLGRRLGRRRPRPHQEVERGACSVERGASLPSCALRPTLNALRSTPEAVDWRLVDYQAKRGGCDEEAIAATLRDAGFAVSLTLYDSKRHRLFHWLAQLLRTKRMVRVLATRQT